MFLFERFATEIWICLGSESVKSNNNVIAWAQQVSKKQSQNTPKGKWKLQPTMSTFLCVAAKQAVNPAATNNRESKPENQNRKQKQIKIQNSQFACLPLGI